MAWTTLPTITPADFGRASWANGVKNNDDDHEDRIVDLEAGGGATGDVDGPASATDNEVPRFDGTTGKLLQTSGITIADGVTGTLAGSNSGDVTLAGAPNYLTLAGQILTRTLINLASHVTGRLPFANLTAATAAGKLLGRGSASGAGDFQEITLGANLSLSGTTLNAAGGAGGTVDLTTDVTGDLPFANLAPLSEATLAGRGAAGGSGDVQEIALGAGLAMSGTTLVAVGSAGEVPAQTSFLVSGGQVTWVSAYTFLVSAATYYIDGTLYQSAQQSIALDAADGSLDRIDVIAVNTSSAVVKLTGTPASTPAEPDVDPATQLKLAIVSVPAASSAPVGASNTNLYLENAGSPAEFNWTSSGSGWTLASTTNPRTGTTDIEATTITTGAYIQGAIGTGTLDPADFATLALHLRSKGAWGNGRTLSVRFQNAGAQVGQAVAIANATFGFDSSATASYQQIAIPMVTFAIPAGTLVDQLRLTRAGSGSIGFYLDDIQLQAAASSGGGGGGLTQAQTDALYATRGAGYLTVAAESALPNERRLVAGTNITLTDAGAGSTLTIDAAGGGGGDSTHTAAYASRPAPSNAGDLFLPSDGFTVQRDTGSVWVPWGPIYPFTEPISGDFSWVNQGAATVSSTKGGTVLTAPAAATYAHRIRAKTAPTPPYTITVYLVPLLSISAASTSGMVFIGFRESSSGKMTLLHLWPASVGVAQLLTVSKWTNETTFSAHVYNQGWFGRLPEWLRITDDNTNLFSEYSYDGQNWSGAVGSIGRTSHGTPDQVCFGAGAPSVSHNIIATLLSWKET